VGEQPYDQENELRWFAQSFEHRSRPSGKGSTADTTAVALSLAIMNPNIALIDQATCRTRRVGAKLNGRVHDFCLCFHTDRMSSNASFFKIPPLVSPFRVALPSRWLILHQFTPYFEIPIAERRNIFLFFSITKRDCRNGLEK